MKIYPTSNIQNIFYDITTNSLYFFDISVFNNISTNNNLLEINDDIYNICRKKNTLIIFLPKNKYITKPAENTYFISVDSKEEKINLLINYCKNYYFKSYYYIESDPSIFNSLLINNCICYWIPKTYIQIQSITMVNIDDYPLSTVWMFDIDETLITLTENINNDHGFMLMDINIPDWLSKIVKRHDPIALVTARYYPNDEQKNIENYVFNDLGLHMCSNQKHTKHNNIPIITYTGGEYKGPYIKNIVDQYKKLGYRNFVYFDDRIDQLESILNYNNDVICFFISLF